MVEEAATAAAGDSRRPHVTFSLTHYERRTFTFSSSHWLTSAWLVLPIVHRPHHLPSIQRPIHCPLLPTAHFHVSAVHAHSATFRLSFSSSFMDRTIS